MTDLPAADDVEWEPMVDVPDNGQVLLLRVGSEVCLAACHGFDGGGGHEWRDETGAERLHIEPDGWAWPPPAPGPKQ